MTNETQRLNEIENHQGKKLMHINNWRQLGLTALTLIGFSLPSIPSASADEGISVEDRPKIEALVKDYLLANPEVIVEAIRIYQRRQETAEAEKAMQAVIALNPQLVDDENTPIAGNPEGDVTVVEFFDYRCAYCKRVGPAVQALMKSDENVRVAFKEWPILGLESVYAARASLASRNQGFYPAFHEALMTASEITEASVIAIAGEIGIDTDRLVADMQAPEIDSHLQLANQLTQALGINGTPAFVVGSQLIPGAVSLAQLQQAVKQARETPSR